MRTGLITFAAMFYSTQPQPTDIDLYRQNQHAIEQTMTLMNSGLDRTGCIPVTAWWDDTHVAIADRCIDGHYKIIAMNYKEKIYWRLWDTQFLYTN